MPVIPTLRQNQRLSQGGVSGFQNPKDARATGENLALLGRTVSSISEGLSREYKEDTHLRSLWEERAKVSAKIEAEVYLSELQNNVNSDDDGSKLIDNYKTRQQNNKDMFLQQVPEEFKGYATMAYETSELTNTAGVLKKRVEVQNTFKLATTSKLNDGIINEVNINPMTYEDARNRAIYNLQTATDNGILSPEQLGDNVKGLDKKLAEAHIAGFLNDIKTNQDYEKYTQAKSALDFHSSIGNISPEEAIKRSKSIDDAYWTGTSRIMSREEKSEKKLKEINEEKVRQEIDKIHLDIQKSKDDPNKTKILKDKLIDLLSSKKGKFGMSEGFKALKVAEEFQDNAMSYEISTRLGNKPTLKDIQELKNLVMFHEAEDRMSPEKAQFWMLRLKAFEEGTKKDPNYNMGVQSIHALIKRTTKAGPFDVMTDFNGENVKQANMLWYKASTWLSQGMHPNTVKQLLQRDMGISSDIVGFPSEFPVSGYTNRTLNTPEAIAQEKADILEAYYGKDKKIDSKKFKKQMEMIKRLEDAQKAKEALNQKARDEFTDPLKMGTAIPFRPTTPNPLGR